MDFFSKINNLEVFQNMSLDEIRALNFCLKSKLISFKKGDICFDIQVIENLGIFIECEEFEAIQDLSVKQKLEYLIKIVSSLNLKLGADYSCKKVLMLIKKPNN